LHEDLDEGVCPPEVVASVAAALDLSSYTHRSTSVAGRRFSFARVKGMAKRSASALPLSKYKSEIYHFYKVNNSL